MNNMGAKSKNSFNDAKPSLLSQDEMLFEGKSRSDFEKVKQKFDGRHAGKSYMGSKNSSRKSDRYSQRIARSTEINFDDCNINMNILESSHSFDSEGLPCYQNQIQVLDLIEKQDNTVDLACSFNLDGFKVSEDDDDEVSSSFE